MRFPSGLSPRSGATPAGNSTSGVEDPRSSDAEDEDERRSDDRSATLLDGWGLYGQGKLDEARRLIMPEAARSPNDPELAYLLGMIFKAHGESSDAVTAFEAVKRSVGGVGDRTRAEMLGRLAQANLELLDAESSKESDAQQ